MKQQKNQEQFARGLPTDAEELVWEQTNGPYGGLIHYLLAAPDGTLYAGTELGGVFRSEDGGNSWTRTCGFVNPVRALAVLGTTLYAGTTGGGVFRASLSKYPGVNVQGAD